MDILCSDKTGTLTLNQLSVDKNTVLVTSPGMGCVSSFPPVCRYSDVPPAAVRCRTGSYA